MFFFLDRVHQEGHGWPIGEVSSCIRLPYPNSSQHGGQSSCAIKPQHTHTHTYTHTPQFLSVLLRAARLIPVWRTHLSFTVGKLLLTQHQRTRLSSRYSCCKHGFPFGLFLTTANYTAAWRSVALIAQPASKTAGPTRTVFTPSVAVIYCQVRRSGERDSALFSL